MSFLSIPPPEGQTLLYYNDDKMMDNCIHDDGRRSREKGVCYENSFPLLLFEVYRSFNSRSQFVHTNQHMASL